MSYRIGSFNCLNFGMGATKDLHIFSEIILRENFDIVALQEIKGNNGLKRLLSALPNYWMGRADDGFVNDYAFIWNSNRIQLAQYESSGICRTYQPHIYKQYRVDKKHGQKDLVREPYYARFFPIGGCAPLIEIRIINAHIRYSKGQPDSSDDEQSLGAITMRKNEFDVLSKTLYPKISDKRYGNNRSVYTILLGDYNLNLKDTGTKSPYLTELFEVGDNIDKQEKRMENRNIKRIFTTQRDLTTLRKPSGQSENQQHGFCNNFDHFTYDAERFSTVTVQCKSIDSVNKYCGGDFEKHRKTVSDHIPIVMELDISKG